MLDATAAPWDIATSLPATAASIEPAQMLKLLESSVPPGVHHVHSCIEEASQRNQYSWRRILYQMCLFLLLYAGLITNEQQWNSSACAHVLTRGVLTKRTWCTAEIPEHFLRIMVSGRVACLREAPHHFSVQNSLVWDVMNCVYFVAGQISNSAGFGSARQLPNACLPNTLVDAWQQTSAPTLRQGPESQRVVQPQHSQHALMQSPPLSAHRSLGAIQQLLLESEHYSDSHPMDCTLYPNIASPSANPWQNLTQASSPVQQEYSSQVTQALPQVPQLWTSLQSRHAPLYASYRPPVQQHCLRWSVVSHETICYCEIVGTSCL